MNLKSSFLPLSLAVCLGATTATLSHDPGLTGATIGTPSGSPSTGSIDVNNSTAFALMYGYPLVLYVQTFEGTLRAVNTNALQHEEGLSAENAEVLVRPNVDTLYSRAAIDLSHADVVISIPETLADRYYVLPFYDLYSNNFANLGPVNDSPPGDYLLTVSSDDEEPGVFMSNEGEGESSEYKGIIRFPTAYGGIMLRILIKNNGTDVDEVRAIQSQINMTSIEREGEPLAPALTLDLLGNGELSPAALLLPFNFTTTQATQTLQLLAQLSATNPPKDQAERDHVTAMLAAAGIRDGTYTAPPGIDYVQVYQMLGAEFMTLMDPVNHAVSQNGWFTLLPSMSGNFGTQYTARAYIAWFGYLQLADYVAAYPTYRDPTVPPSTLVVMRLAANESYVMTFSEKPPVTGFWSITAYDSTNYLVPNDLRRYTLGDRSNLTYPDGTQVYADASSNGAFSILIQPADVAPGANWTNNWLPSPAGGGDFTVNLRWYGVTPALSNGSYAYPIVSRHGSIF